MQGLGISALATRTIHARHVLVGWLGYDIVLRGLRRRAQIRRFKIGVRYTCSTLVRLVGFGGSNRVQASFSRVNARITVTDSTDPFNPN